MERLREEPAGWVLPLIVALFLAAMVPALTWIEFSGGSENLNVATALEIRRTGNWLIPTLQGQPRIAKPPLTAWITALSIREQTLRHINSGEPAEREHGYRELAWDVRWPFLLMACLTLCGVHALGRIVGGGAVGVAAALICGTSYAFLRFSRGATTDVTLNLFVTLTNVFLAQALLQGRTWRGFAGAGLMLGLAFMSKGPVAIAETIAPAAIYGILKTFQDRRWMMPRWWKSASLLGLAAMLAVGLPWYALVVIEMRRRGFNLAQFWFSEVTGVGASDLEGNPWYTHLSYVPMMLPWVFFLIGGFYLALLTLTPRPNRSESIPKREREGLQFMALLVLVPILLMSLSRDRKERFLLPMFGPGAVLAGYAATTLAASRKDQERLDKAVEWGHWGILFGAGVAFPIVGATRMLKTAAGVPWFTPAQSALLAASCGAILITGIACYRSRPLALVWASACAMLLVQAGYAYGYSKTDLSAAWPLSTQIRFRRPDAVPYACIPRRSLPQDLSIYLNRIVMEVKDPAQVIDPAGVLVTRWKKGRPQIVPPSEWIEIARANDGEDLWLAWAPPPVVERPQPRR